MTTAETSAPSFDSSLAESSGGTLRKLVAPFAVGIALLSALMTFMVLSGLTPIEPTEHVVYSFLLINAATILLLVGIIVREIWQVVQARRRGRAAARLHIQIVSLFSVIAVLPSVLVAVVANLTIDRGLDRLFSGPTRAAIQNSLSVARAYTYDHALLIGGDILGMANDISRARPLYDQDRRTFLQLLTASAATRNLPGAMLIDKDANVLESAQTGIQRDFTTPPREFLNNVGEDKPEISVFPEANYVAAVIRLRAEYLYTNAADRQRIAFNFTSGDRVAFARWAEGWRPVVAGNRVTWARNGARGMDRAQFAAYLEKIFTYAGSQSLERELVQVRDSAKVLGGDVFIQGGFPGHAVIVVDTAEDPNGRRVMLLAQSFMPAQSIHVLKNPAGGVWYDAAAGDPETPEWKFRAGHARRFREEAP